MNPLLNPLMLPQILKSYLEDPKRLKRIRQEDLEQYQNKSLRKIVDYAYTVPLYHEKYKKIGIHPRDIKSINDIKKLPVVTKEDIREFSPDGIISPHFNKKTAIMVSTGGSTGRSLPLYFDMYTVVKAMLGFVRAFREYGVDWRKTRMSLLIDLSENSFENTYFIKSIFSALKPVISQKNMQIFDLFSDPMNVIPEIDKFQPEFIAGYPYAFIQLAIFKKRGYGKNIAPQCMMSSGSYFDPYTRKTVEKVFDATVYDFYAATESGPLAFECKRGRYHVHSDLVFTEYLRDGEDVSSGEPGSLVVTKLYGRGTPIIRYTGIDDIVSRSNEPCDCGIISEVIERIHGRRTDSIVLPNGKLVLTSFFENIIGETVYELNSDKIRRIQILQHSMNRLEIKIQIDEKLRPVRPSVEELFRILKRKLHDRLGSDIDITITEVDSFNVKDAYLVSKIDKSKIIGDSYVL